MSRISFLILKKKIMVNPKTLQDLDKYILH